ncbi:T9SS type A sorting domain-containing protein [Algibacter sp. AS12]|uniref:T9SS type A sorting domain-containing protein n=1 Tax=Algibacter sp. AS12 TaxID=3135773 RepID=UPI00398B9688
MKEKLLVIFLTFTFFSYAQNPNLVTNGDFEDYPNPNSTPNRWSSSSDFGTFNQNTTDFVEGTSSVEFTAGFSDLMLFTLADIPLEAGKTYTVSYSYKYLGTEFDANDNIEFSFYSSTNPFLHGTNIQDNNWNTVTTQYTPTETKTDFEATIRVIPSGIGSEYKVLIDDVQVYEGLPLSTQAINLENTISVYTSKNKQLNINKPADLVITNVSVYSILGQQQKLTPNTKDLSSYNLNTFSTGVYILKITTNKGVITKKILIK